MCVVFVVRVRCVAYVLCVVCVVCVLCVALCVLRVGVVWSKHFHMTPSM